MCPTDLMLFSQYQRHPLVLYLMLTPEQAEMALSVYFSLVILYYMKQQTVILTQCFFYIFSAVKI